MRVVAYAICSSDLHGNAKVFRAYNLFGGGGGGCDYAIRHCLVFRAYTPLFLGEEGEHITRRRLGFLLEPTTLEAMMPHNFAVIIQHHQEIVLRRFEYSHQLLDRLPGYLNSLRCHQPSSQITT